MCSVTPVLAGGSIPKLVFNLILVSVADSSLHNFTIVDSGVTNRSLKTFFRGGLWCRFCCICIFNRAAVLNCCLLFHLLFYMQRERFSIPLTSQRWSKVFCFNRVVYDSRSSEINTSKFSTPDVCHVCRKRNIIISYQ